MNSGTLKKKFKKWIKFFFKKEVMGSKYVGEEREVFMQMSDPLT